MNEAKQTPDQKVINTELTKLKDEVMAFQRVENQAEDEVNWNAVRLIVEGYTEKYPEEVVGCAEAVKMERNSLTDKKFGTTGADSDMRQVMKLPNRLQVGLQTKYPKIFTDQKNLRQFLKMYYIFQIPEKL